MQPRSPSTAVDTTAAGDTFCGVLVAALTAGEALRGRVAPGQRRRGARLHAAGAQSSIPTSTRSQRFLASHTS